MRKFHEDFTIGERHQNNQGEWFTITRVNGCKDIEVTFDKNNFVKNTTAHYVRTGSIRLPKYFVGDTFVDKLGNRVELISKKSSTEYTFRWEDGYTRTCQSSVLVLGTLMREEDSKLLNPQVKVGNRYTNTQGVELEVIKYEKASKITVKVHGPVPHEIITTQGNLVKGTVHDRYSPSVAGVGIIGDVQDVDVTSQVYTSWVGMIKRCYVFYDYNPRSKINYGDCSVNEDFKHFEKYIEWYDKQIKQPNWHLDKDLLVPGNREYGPETCVFLPRALNTFLTIRKNDRGPWPLGVTLHPSTGHFEAACNRDGKRIYLGVYKTAEDAFYVYKEARERYAKDLAERWKSQIDPRAYEALIRYEVNITD